MQTDETYQVKMREWKDATWQFLLEHCKILPSGKIRVIFDTDSQNDFEKRVWARYKGIYHRGDYKQVQETSESKLAIFKEVKEKKKAKYKNDKLKRQRVSTFNNLPEWKRFVLKILRIDI